MATNIVFSIFDEVAELSGASHVASFANVDKIGVRADTHWFQAGQLRVLFK